MRIANVAGRLTLVPPEIASIVDGEKVLGIDVERASSGRFGADPQAVYRQWDDFMAWGRVVDLSEGDVTVVADLLGPVAPAPGQVFAIGVNYAEHAAETHLELPPAPAVFTKFPTCLAGPAASVPTPPGKVDWEVELVAVIGRQARHVPRGQAWDHVAGLTVGQDFSERGLQMTGRPPQFSMGKSFPAFGPIGPALVTVDELADPDDLAIACSIDGEQMQSGRTSDMVFDVPALIAHLSSVLTLLPGDLIFTGTPPGVGAARTPPRFLRSGELVESEIEGIGRIRNLMVG